MLARHALAGVIVLMAASVEAGCDTTCPYTFDVLSVITADRLVPCCETFVVQTFGITSRDAELDVAVHQDPTIAARVDAWVTPATCEQLFEGGSSTPKCDVLVGPVLAGSVSARYKAPPGNYRIFVRPRNAGDSPVAALVDVRIWGKRCLTGPSAL